ncbi:hypothetical protein NECAME_06197, partial [Necator americanus]
VHAIPLRSSWVMTCAYAPSGSFVACGGNDWTTFALFIHSKLGREMYESRANCLAIRDICRAAGSWMITKLSHLLEI